MFGRIFDTEAPFWQGVARVGDLVLLNLLLIASSIPLVTFGAAMTALYDTLWRLHDGQGGGTTALYLRSFHANLGRATLLWAIAAPIIGGLAASWALLPVADLLVAKVLVSVVVALVFPFPWFLQARFENPVGATLKNALLIPLVRLPYALGAFGVAAGIVALAVAVAITVPAALPPLLLGGWPMAAYATIPLLNRAVSPWLPEAPPAA